MNPPTIKNARGLPEIPPVSPSTMLGKKCEWSLTCTGKDALREHSATDGMVNLMGSLRPHEIHDLGLSDFGKSRMLIPSI